jgi:hypothetical protein
MYAVKISQSNGKAGNIFAIGKVGKRLAALKIDQLNLRLHV